MVCICSFYGQRLKPLPAVLDTVASRWHAQPQHLWSWKDQHLFTPESTPRGRCQNRGLRWYVMVFFLSTKDGRRRLALLASKRPLTLLILPVKQFLCAWRASINISGSRSLRARLCMVHRSFWPSWERWVLKWTHPPLILSPLPRAFSIRVVPLLLC